MILGRDIGQVRSFCKFCGVSLNIRRRKTEFEIVRAWKFWCVQKCYSTNNNNIRLLGVRHRGFRYRYGNHRIWWLQRVSRKDGDANGVLAMIWQEARFFCKDGQNNQWIMSGEPVVSKDQRAERIKWNNIEVQIHIITSGKNYRQVSNFRDSAINEPSNKQRATGRVADVFRWWVSTNLESTKQWVDLELTRAWNGILLRWSWPRIKKEVRKTKNK